MFDKKICTISLTIVAFLTEQIMSETYYVSSNSKSDYTYNGMDNTLHIYCDEADTHSGYIFNCGNANECFFHCEEKKCAVSADLYALNSNTLYVDFGINGQECLKMANVYVPDNGSAYFTTSAQKGFKGMKVHSGTNTKSIIIDSTSNQMHDDDAKEMDVYAATAEYLKITIGDGQGYNTAMVECPVDSQYNGPDIAPCIIDGSNAQEMKNINIYAPDGIPKGVYVLGSSNTDSVNVICTNIGGQSIFPFDVTSDCWFTRHPTNDPTIDPTNNPTSIPTKNPTPAPTLNPTLAPTLNPTSAPTLNPTPATTVYPTYNPTIEPTTDPTNNPTESPTVEPTYNPIISSTPSHTTSTASVITAILTAIHPTESPNYPNYITTEHIENDEYTKSQISDTSFVFIIIGIAIIILIFCVYCLYRVTKPNITDHLSRFEFDTKNKNGESMNGITMNNDGQQHTISIQAVPDLCTMNSISGGNSLYITDHISSSPDLYWEQKENKIDSLSERQRCYTYSDGNMVQSAFRNTNYDGNMERIDGMERIRAFSETIETMGKQQEDCNNESIMIWLEKHGLKQYYHTFVMNGYETFDIIRAITDKSELEDVGIMNETDKELIMSAIRKLKAINALDVIFDDDEIEVEHITMGNMDHMTPMEPQNLSVAFGKMTTNIEPEGIDDLEIC